MSASTTNSFFDLIEWTAVQDWCSGKVGLLGVSYYAGKLIQDRGAAVRSICPTSPLSGSQWCVNDVELWPASVVVEKGGWLVLQVSSEDSDPGVGLSKHNSPIDRYVDIPSY